MLTFLRVATVALMLCACAATAAEAPGAFPTAALQVVLDTQQDAIRAADSADSWGHDTKIRAWAVQRPFEPGTLDTTHMFVVTYSIDGKVVASWQVDTRAGTAVAQPQA